MAEEIIGTDVNQVEITSLSHIKGQPQVQELLKVSIDAFFQNRANNENSSFGPVALLGPSGTGRIKRPDKAIHRLIHKGALHPKKISGRLVFDRKELDKVLANGDHKRGRGRPRKG